LSLGTPAGLRAPFGNMASSQRRHSLIPMRSRVFAEVNQQKSKEYWDYENFNITWGSQDGYEVIKRVGRGKYSEVFEGVNTKDNTKCIIKMLKPVKKKKIKREIKILQNLKYVSTLLPSAMPMLTYPDTEVAQIQLSCWT